jgi:hypothetical protein
MSSTRSHLPVGMVLATAALSAATVAPVVAPAETPAPEGPDRPADQTFLTYPEWFLVFSPRERAAYLSSRDAPSRFPYLGHVAQLWQGYRSVSRATRAYPFNFGYHVMIAVIATSTTAEYGMQSAYETLVGRAVESLPAGLGREDAYAARVAQEYVDFIEVRPWYEFDFARRLRGLWDLPVGSGTNLPRSLERRFWLSTEYGGKALYGALIHDAAAASYVPPATTTRIVVDTLPESALHELPDLHRVADSPGETIADVPRYQAFTDHARVLAREGVSFRRIAGNDGAIVLTAIVPDAWAPRPGGPYRALLVQPLLTVAGRNRALLVTRVPELSDALRDLEAAGIPVEHVFDY